MAGDEVRTLTWAEDEIIASHLDPHTYDHPHDHTWRVRAYWDTSAGHTDVRVLKSKLKQTLHAFAGKRLNDFPGMEQATCETFGRALLQLLGADRVDCWRTAGQDGGDEGCTLERAA